MFILIFKEGNSELSSRNCRLVQTHLDTIIDFFHVQLYKQQTSDIEGIFLNDGHSNFAGSYMLYLFIKNSF